jgi:hypothetical protein
VVFLDENRIEQTDAVIRAAAALHGVLLRNPQSRNRLARVEDPALRALEGVDVRARHRRGCGKHLQEVERASLAREQRASRAFERAELLIGANTDRFDETLRRTTQSRTELRLRA